MHSFLLVAALLCFAHAVDRKDEIAKVFDRLKASNDVIPDGDWDRVKMEGVEWVHRVMQEDEDDGREENIEGLRESSNDGEGSRESDEKYITIGKEDPRRFKKSQEKNIASMIKRIREDVEELAGTLKDFKEQETSNEDEGLREPNKKTITIGKRSQRQFKKSQEKRFWGHVRIDTCPSK